MNDDFTPPPSNPDRTGSAVLDRAVAALKSEGASADGPLPLVAERTLAALWEAESRAQRSRARWVMRVAAVVVLGVCAVAASVVLVERHRAMLAQKTPVPAPAPAPHNSEPARDDARRYAMVDSHPGDPTTPADPTAVPTPPVTVASELMVTGHVYFGGPIPSRRLADLGGFPRNLIEAPGPIYDESLVVGRDGSMANVVISISGALPAGHAMPTPPPVVLDQKYCAFVPHVVAAMVGQQLVLHSSDRLPHFSHAVNSLTAPTFNTPLPATGPRVIDTFQGVETFEVRSDVHPWMQAWVRVLDNPYFDVSRADGGYSIKDLPPGTYTLRAWHETLGEQEKQITVTGGEAVVVDFTFDGK